MVMVDNQLWEQLGEHCIITGKTVLAIFEKLQQISDQLGSFQEALVQREKEVSHHPIRPPHLTWEKGKGPNSVGHERAGKHSEANIADTYTSCCLIVTQIVLEVTNNYLNKGKWTNRQKVFTSLSKLLRTEKSQIDIKNITSLPAPRSMIRLQLEFYKPKIPLMLFRMRRFLNTFSIATKRVFSNMDRETTPLPPGMTWGKI